MTDSRNTLIPKAGDEESIDSCSLVDVLKRSITLVEPLARLLDVGLSFSIGPSVTYPPAMLSIPRKNVLLFFTRCLNLSLNALECGLPTRELLVKAKNEGTLFVLEVADNGRELPAGLRDEWIRLTPYLGDFQASGGSIEWAPQPFGGNALRLMLPTEASQPELAARTVASPGSPVARALVIEDSDLMLKVFVKLLQRKGYIVNTASDGCEGLARLRQDDYDLVLLDMNLPLLDGNLLFAVISREFPHMAGRFIATSGDVEKYGDFLKQYDIPFVPKPIHEATFFDAVDARLAARTVVSPGSPVARELIIEDSDLLLKVFIKLLQRRRHKVDTESDGYRGLVRLRQGDYDLVLLDMNLPSIEGKLLFKAISKELPRMVGRFIATSGDVEKYGDFVKQYNIPFLPKPIQEATFFAVVDARLAEYPPKSTDVSNEVTEPS